MLLLLRHRHRLLVILNWWCPWLLLLLLVVRSLLQRAQQIGWGVVLVITIIIGAANASFSEGIEQRVLAFGFTFRVGARWFIDAPVCASLISKACTLLPWHLLCYTPNMVCRSRTYTTTFQHFFNKGCTMRSFRRCCCKGWGFDSWCCKQLCQSVGLLGRFYCLV